jgi:AcrR family transcriptional regulator
MARPRDDSITEAVVDATRQLCGEIGYRNLTMEALAARAGTTKPAIRRRWPSLRHVVVDAMTRDNVSMAVPDNGSTRSDLIVLVEELRVSMGDVMLGRILPALVVDLSDDGDLRRRFLDSVWRPRRERADRILRRGVERGELRADLDFELAQDLLAATVIYRFLFAHADLDPALSEHIVDYVLRGIAAGPTESS